MKITVIGTGYVGLIAGLGFAKWGNEVVCLDVIPEKIEKLQKGICPIYEPGAEVQLSDGLSSGRLRFTCDVKSAVEHGELIFIAVGTPEAADGSADLCYVYSAADEIADYMQSYKLVVDKSTVPVGTARALRQRIAERLKAMGKNIPFDVASNPEFLREGRAVGDFDNPDRIVLGVASMEFLFSKADTNYAIFNCRENRERMVTLLHMLLAEADRSLDGCETVCQDLLEVLLIWLVRCTTISLQLEEAAPTENRECAEIKRYLDTNYREDISLDLLAELAHLNKYYLAHTFQREYGISPITYLNRRRIEESKHMLGNTGYSLAQISELMGFSSPSYFSQCFRKAEGMTPNEYRRQTRQGKRPAPTKRHEV